MGPAPPTAPHVPQEREDGDAEDVGPDPRQQVEERPVLAGTVGRDPPGHPAQPEFAVREEGEVEAHGREDEVYAGQPFAEHPAGDLREQVIDGREYGEY